MRIEPTELSALASDLETQPNMAEAQTIVMTKNTITPTATQARTDSDRGKRVFS